MHKDYNVQFVGDYFSMSVFVEDAHNEEVAVAKANTLILDHYGWDVEAVSNDVEVYPQD